MSKHEYAIAIDIGGTKTLVGLVTTNGQILIQRRFPTLVSDGPDVHLSTCLRTVEECLQQTGVAEDSVIGIGITVPGLADPQNGILVYAPYSGWRDVPVREVFSRRWPDKPIIIANDVNACALGEMMFGSGGNFQNFIWVTISTGIGSGIVTNRKIYEGERLCAGELGHVIVEWEKGKRCGCGNFGCLEAHASGTGITNRAKQIVAEDGPDCALANYFAECNLSVSAESVAQAARAGIKPALEIYAEAGNYIGRAFSYAANLLNPGCIFVGGGVSLSFDLLESAIRTTFMSSVIGNVNKQIPIRATSLGYEAGLLGAASLVYSK